MIKNKTRSALVLALALTLSACASTYHSPDLPTGDNSKIAILEPKEFSPLATFFIDAIDGKSRGVGWFNRFELTPGRRSITAGANEYSLRSASITRYFTARAGIRYHFVVHVDHAAKRWGFSIVEVETGQRVDSAY